MSGCHNCWPHYMKRVCDTAQHSSQSWEIGLVYDTLVAPLQLFHPSTQLLLRLYTHTHTAMTSPPTCPTRACARTHTTPLCLLSPFLCMPPRGLAPDTARWESSVPTHPPAPPTAHEEQQCRRPSLTAAERVHHSERGQAATPYCMHTHA